MVCCLRAEVDDTPTKPSGKDQINQQLRMHLKLSNLQSKLRRTYGRYSHSLILQERELRNPETRLQAGEPACYL